MMNKMTFKICEAVALGLDYYYMGPKDRRKITEMDRLEAEMLIPMQPSGWMQESYPWQVFKTTKKEKGKEKLGSK